MIRADHFKFVMLRYPGAVGLKRSAGITKPGTQRVPGGLTQATQVAFVL